MKRKPTPKVCPHTTPNHLTGVLTTSAYQYQQPRTPSCPRNGCKDKRFIFQGQESLTLEDGTDVFSREDGKELPISLVIAQKRAVLSYFAAVA
jgi:hypothetical protein